MSEGEAVAAGELDPDEDPHGVLGRDVTGGLPDEGYRALEARAGGLEGERFGVRSASRTYD